MWNDPPRRTWFGQANPLTAKAEEDETTPKRDTLIKRPGGPPKPDRATKPPSLGAAVGRIGANDRADVKTVQGGLMRTGALSRVEAAAEAGRFGTATERATKDYQRSKGLKVDGLVTPKGPTLASLTADAFKPAQEQTRPKAPVRPKPAPRPRLSAEAVASNARTVEALRRTTNTGPMAELLTTALKTFGARAEAEVGDLFGQYHRVDPRGAQRLATDVDARAPTPNLGTTLLAAAVPPSADNGKGKDGDQDKPKEPKPPKEKEKENRCHELQLALNEARSGLDHHRKVETEIRAKFDGAVKETQKYALEMAARGVKMSVDV